MEKDSASSSPHLQQRNRMTRNTRALTPDAQRIQRVTKSSDRDTRTMAVGGDVIQESKYVVRGILNVGPPSPSGSTSSSNSNSGGERSSHMSSGSHAYRAKLLSKKEKAKTAEALHRSQSTSRQSSSCQTNDDIFTFLRRAKRSLSAPRKREGSADSGKMTPQMEAQEAKITQLEQENYVLSNKTHDDDDRNRLLEHNLNRFEEERRQFEREKLKFLEEKRELDRLRLQRFERYKRELEARRLGLQPNYDIENPNDYKVARKIVLDNMNERLTEQRRQQQQQQQDSGSEEDEEYESETEITVVENVPKARTPLTPKRLTTDTKNESSADTTTDVITMDAQHDNSIISAAVVDEEPTAKSNENEKSAASIVVACSNQTNGKVELSNGLKKLLDQTDAPPTESIKDEIKSSNGFDVENDAKNPEKVSSLIKMFWLESRQVWRHQLRVDAIQWQYIKSDAKKCSAYLVLLMLWCGVGGILFQYVEGNYELTNKAGVKRVKRDFIDQLWLSSHNLREDDWKSMARTRLRKFEEELQVAIESGMRSYSGHTQWNFVNAVFYCLDMCTTIGYGHVTPSTTSGQIFSIVYAIIGIPIFLILLADFGKLFTRIIKFLWVFVRRLYYTGSCRKVRKTSQAQDVMKGINLMYDFMRRPSQAFDPRYAAQQQANMSQNESPLTPVPETYEIDDEFNLPISVAITMLLSYMMFGAVIYQLMMRGEWSFFESLYFVFISISTIGFGDLVPDQPIYMMLSIIYLIFGLALTSMCINVVQLKISDHFKQASSKLIGASIAEAASQASGAHSPLNELQSVHPTTNNGSRTTIPVIDISVDGKSASATNNQQKP